MTSSEILPINIHEDLGLPKVKKTEIHCPFIKLLIKIKNFVVFIFNKIKSLFCSKSKNVELNEEYKKIVEAFKAWRKEPEKLNESHSFEEIEITTNGEVNQTTGIIIDEEEYVDPVFTELQSTVQNVLKTVLDTVHEHKIEPALKKSNKFGEIKIFDEEFLEVISNKIKEKLDENTEKINAILLKRVFALVEKLKFPKLMDEMLNVFHNHTGGIIAFERMKETSERLLNTVGEQVTRQRNNPIIKEFEEATQSSINPEEEIKTFSKNLGLRAYAKEEICHPIIREAIEKGTKSNSPSLNGLLNVKIETFLTEKIESFIPLIFPNVTLRYESGETEEVDGIKHFIRLLLPKELEKQKVLFLEKANKHTKSLSEASQEELTTFIHEQFDKAMHLTETIICNELNPRINTQMVKILKTLFLKQLESTSIDNLFVNTLIPKMRSGILLNFTTSILTNQLDHLAPKIIEAINAYYPTNEQETFKELVGVLRLKVAKHSLVAEEKLNNIGDMTSPIIEQLHQVYVHEIIKKDLVAFGQLLMQLNKAKTPVRKGKIYNKICLEILTGIKKNYKKQQKAFVELDVKAFKRFIKPVIDEIAGDLDHYIEDATETSEEVETNEVYGKLMNNLLRRIGRIDNLLVNSFPKIIGKIVSRKVSQATGVFNRSPKELLKRGAKKINKQLLETGELKKTLEQMMTSPKEIVGANEKIITEQALDKKTRKIARLIYALIIYVVKSRNHNFFTKGLATFSVKKLGIGEDETVIYNLISRIYKKMVGQKELNLNFAVQMIDTLERHLKKASGKIPNTVVDLSI